MIMYKLSVVIPAYNEEKKIAKDIEAVHSYFKENSIDGELIIVDDGSKDKTYETAKNYVQQFPSLRVINYGQNRGKGYAVKTGILEAQGEFILFADSGICVPYKNANLGLELLKSGYDIALGSRRTKDNKSKILVSQPLYRRIGSKIFKFLIQAFNIIPPGIEDTQCGFKLFKKEVAHNLYKKCQVKGFMIDLEMLRIAKKENYKIGIFPVEWSNDPDTRYHAVIGSFENLLQIINIVLRT